MAMKFIKVFYDWLDGWEALTMEERGRMMTILLQFARGEEPMEPEGNERFLLPVYRQCIVRDQEIYQDICEKRRVSGRLGAAKRREHTEEMGYTKNTSHQIEANAHKSDQVEASAGKSDQVEASAGKSDQMEANADKSDQVEASASKSDQVEASAGKSDQVEASAGKSDQVEANADTRWYETIQMVASRMEPEYAKEAQIQAELEEKRQRTRKWLLEEMNR